VHPLHRRVIEPGPVTRAELLTWSPTADATTLFWCDADADATASVVRVVDSLVEKELVEDGDGTYAFLRQDGYEFAPAVLDAIAAARGLSPAGRLSGHGRRAVRGGRRSGGARRVPRGAHRPRRRCHRAGPRVRADGVAVAAHRSAARRVGGGSRGGGLRDTRDGAVEDVAAAPSTARRARPANWCGRPRQR